MMYNIIVYFLNWHCSFLSVACPLMVVVDTYSAGEAPEEPKTSVRDLAAKFNRLGKVS